MAFKWENGKIVELTPNELDAMQPQLDEWHYPECPIRVTFTDEVKLMWLDKYKENELLGTYPEITAILKYMKGLNKKSVTHNGDIHIYLEEIYPEHRAIIEGNGGQIEKKPN